MTARGAAWEGTLDALHDSYARRGLAWIARCHPPRRLHRTGPPDYCGVIGPYGRAVVADAKDCASGRAPIVPRHQALDLGAVAARGGLALLLVRWRGQPLVVLWSDVADAWWRSQPLPITTFGRPFDATADGWLGCVDGW